MNDWLVALVAVVGLVASTVGGWPLTAGVLRLAARSADAGGAVGPDAGRSDEPGGSDRPVPDARPAPDAAGGPTGPQARTALRGGTWIGILERTAITGVVLLGYPAGVALVVAVKGLGRYSELRDHPGASERFVIGTLASMLWAAAVGVACRAIIGAGPA